MTLEEYILKYKNEINRIECLYNTDNSLTINDNTKSIFSCREGQSEVELDEEEYTVLNKELLSKTPLKVFLFNEYDYNEVMNKMDFYENLPPNKKNMVAIFDSDIKKLDTQFD